MANVKNIKKHSKETNRLIKMRVYHLNWVLVASLILWTATTIILLIGCNTNNSFDNTHYVGACQVVNVYYYNDNKDTIAYFMHNNTHTKTIIYQNVSILHNYNPNTSVTYMNTFYPVDSYVGCLIFDNEILLYFKSVEVYFIVALVIFGIWVILITYYSIAQACMYKKRLSYQRFDDRDAQDLSLFQNAMLPVPLERIKTDFAYAQKMLWDYADRIPTAEFEELRELQLKALVTIDLGGDKSKFMRAVSKTIKKVTDV